MVDLVDLPVSARRLGCANGRSASCAATTIDLHEMLASLGRASEGLPWVREAADFFKPGSALPELTQALEITDLYTPLS